jgi:hypothetical protein
MPKKRPIFEATEVPVDPFSSTPANRARAHKLRLQMRANMGLDEADSTWLAGYEEQRAATSEGISRGASRGRKVSYTEEEHEAAGEVDAAAAAAAGAMVREEGRRLDSMIGVSMTAMQKAFDMSMKMCQMMSDRNRELETAHVSMMEAYRSHFLGRVEAEAELEVMKRTAEEGDKDSLSSLAEMLLPYILPALGPTAEETPATDVKKK